MAAGFIPAGLQTIWNVWNIRGFMILSLTTQMVLTLTSPVRQKTSNFVLISIVWSAYFLADWIAIFAFGLISNAGCRKSPSYINVTEDLLALWASFLLIHLGGPDTITAFSLEDNALWLRHLVGLIAQVFTFLYIFVKTLPDNKLMAPILLIFGTGVIKYGERTRALYLASLQNFKKSLIKLPNQRDTIKIVSDGKDEEPRWNEKLKCAFHFFQIFKGLTVDIMPNHMQRLESREFFLKLDDGSSFRIMDIELKMLYEVFYTKILAANSSWGVIIRNIAYYMSVAALILFCLNKKEGLQTIDIRITYALLAGVIILDVSNDILFLGSSLMMNKQKYLFWQFISRCLIPPFIGAFMYGWGTRILYQYCCGYDPYISWSGKMGAFNLLVHSFEESHPRKRGMTGRCCRAIFGCIIEKIGIAEAIAKMKYTSKIGMDNGIWKYTFGVLKGRAAGANEPNQVREIYEARGELALRDGSDELKRYVIEFEYDQSVLFWHVATEICYRIDRDLNKDDENVKFSKIFSDYMIYLLVSQPDMTSAVADIFHQRYSDTCEELKCLERRVRAESLDEFCLKILEGYSASNEPDLQDRSAGASVLIDSCSLVRILAQTERKWEILCTIWVELLSYAAGHCRADSHARLVSEGGEFVTYVWLLMAHFGIGPRFPKN